MCITPMWENKGKEILASHVKYGASITSLGFKDLLRQYSEKATQSEVGEWLRDQFKNGSMKDYKSKTNTIYVTYYLPFKAKVKRFIRKIFG